MSWLVLGYLVLLNIIYNTQIISAQMCNALQADEDWLFIVRGVEPIFTWLP